MIRSSEPLIQRALRTAALLSLFAAVCLAVGFQLSKTNVISAISPFAEDPFDAVGSIAFQVALAGGLLGLIRWMRLHGDTEFSPYRARMILRACALVVASIAATAITDVVAVFLSPLPGKSPWEAVLIGGLVAVASAGGGAGIAVGVAIRRLRSMPASPSPVGGSTLADLFDDLLIAVERIGGWIGDRIPLLGWLVEGPVRLAGRVLGWLNATWISPRAHPWRFAAACGLISGSWLALAKAVFEGPAPTLDTTLLVSAIFIGVEFVAVLGAYLVLGGWLGIRPPLKKQE